MKKEFCALALLLALLAGGLLNARYLRGFTAGLNEKLSRSQELCEAGDAAGALALAREAAGDWRARELYAGVFIRHAETDAVTDAFLSLLGELESGEAGAAQGLYAGLAARIENLYNMERVSLGSVF